MWELIFRREHTWKCDVSWNISAFTSHNEFPHDTRCNYTVKTYLLTYLWLKTLILIDLRSHTNVNDYKYFIYNFKHFMNHIWSFFEDISNLQVLKRYICEGWNPEPPQIGHNWITNHQPLIGEGGSGSTSRHPDLISLRIWGGGKRRNRHRSNIEK